MDQSRINITQVNVAEDEIDAVVRVLRSGNLREGAVCREFEEKFAAHVGARYAVSVSSGTAALHISYLALLSRGDEVLMPTFTFIATASMLTVMGAKPIFCDVDPRTFTLDVADARKRITPHTRAIAPVHLFGNPCDVDGVRTLADEFGLKIVWDAAQSHGARWHARDVGSLPQAVAYSFYPSKNMTTGEGGIITTDDQSLYEKMKLLRSHGQSGKYYHTIIGMNYRLTDVMAALGIYQLEKLDGWVTKRRANAQFLTRALANTPGIQTPVEQRGGESSFNLYSILVDPAVVGSDRDQFVRRLTAEGIGATVNYPRALHQQPVYQELAAGVRLPASEELSGRILSIPSHPGLNESQLTRVADTVCRVAAAVPA